MLWNGSLWTNVKVSAQKIGKATGVWSDYYINNMERNNYLDGDIYSDEEQQSNFRKAIPKKRISQPTVNATSV